MVQSVKLQDKPSSKLKSLALKVVRSLTEAIIVTDANIFNQNYM